jgi:hypothetical protein
MVMKKFLSQFVPSDNAKEVALVKALEVIAKYFFLYYNTIGYDKTKTQYQNINSLILRNILS